MIYYLLDFFINNLKLYTSTLILIKLDDYNKMDMLCNECGYEGEPKYEEIEECEQYAI